MNHDEQLIKAGFADMRMTRPPQAIIASGDTRRRRNRLAGTSALLAAVGAGAALAGPVIGVGHATASPHVSSPAPAGTSHSQSPQTSRPQIDVEMAGFSVRSRADGSVEVIVNDLSDPAKPQQVLASAGAPAVVTWNKYCLVSPSPAPGPDDWRLKAVTYDKPRDPKAGEDIGDRQVFVLHPAELHPGWKFGLRVFTSSKGTGTGALAVVLPPGAPTC